MAGPVGVLLMLPSQSCVQAEVPVEATSWGPPPNSFLGMMVCSLDKSSLHPRGPGTKEESVTPHATGTSGTQLSDNTA
jgi:hypothetical protein